jgi:hypothetical protein
MAEPDEHPQNADRDRVEPGSGAERPAASPLELQAAPLDFVTPQLTIRALATGMTLGGVLSTCNIYTGLKIGWSTNMSITGILLA